MTDKEAELFWDNYIPRSSNNNDKRKVSEIDSLKIMIVGLNKLSTLKIDENVETLKETILEEIDTSISIIMESVLEENGSEALDIDKYFKYELGSLYTTNLHLF